MSFDLLVKVTLRFEEKNKKQILELLVSVGKETIRRFLSDDFRFGNFCYLQNVFLSPTSWWFDCWVEASGRSSISSGPMSSQQTVKLQTFSSSL